MSFYGVGHYGAGGGGKRDADCRSGLDGSALPSRSSYYSDASKRSRGSRPDRAGRCASGGQYSAGSNYMLRPGGRDSRITGDHYSMLSGSRASRLSDAVRETAERTVSRSSGYYGSREAVDEGRNDDRCVSHLSTTTDGEDELDAEELQQRMQATSRLMEESSTRSLQTLHQTLFVGTGTAEELDRQAKVMSRVEAELDAIDDDLHQSTKNMRQIKSVFGGLGNFFARRKQVRAETDPTVSAPPSGPPDKSKQEGVPGKRSSKAKAGKKASDTSPSSDKSSGEESTGGHGQARGTGIEVVDRNLDGMEQALFHLKGVGETISVQLKDSDAQIGRVRAKMHHSTAKMKKLERDMELEMR